MTWLLIFLSIALSLLSVSMMSYIAMATIMAPWVAPIISVILMVTVLQFVHQEWFKKYVIIIIGAGSLGGIVGMSVGLTWPSLYFLHEEIFTSWMSTSWYFAGSIGLVVVVAGFFGFLIANFLRYHLIVEHKLKFPMSQLVHNIVFVDDKRQGFVMLLHGVVMSSSWNLFLLIAQNSVRLYTSQLQAIPVLVSIGFVAGHSITIPLLIGLIVRIFSLNVVRDNYFVAVKTQEFVLTFSAGMLIIGICLAVFSFIHEVYVKKTSLMETHMAKLMGHVLSSKLYVVAWILSFITSSIVLYVWDVSLLQQIYVIVTLFLLCNFVAMMLGRVGVIDIQGFINFMILPFTYLFFAHTYSTIFIIVFATICLGVVIDLLFTYKLAYLAEISHIRMLKYQIIGFICAAGAIGFMVWWYIHTLSLGSHNLLAQQALNQELFVTFSQYNPYIFLLGILIGLLIYGLQIDMLVVIGGLMMPIAISFWFVLAGGLSYLVKQREKIFPLCFGVYGAHSVWMVARALATIF